MSDSDGIGTGAERAEGEPTRVRVRKRRSRPAGSSGSSGSPPTASGPPKSNRPLLYTGIGLIAVGVAILLWVAWEFWGTNVVSHHRQHEVASQLKDGWGKGQDKVHTKFGDATAILHVPRFGKNYGVPVLEGDSEEVLAAGIAHFPHTQNPGQVGNYALAAHRVTHGEPFAKFPSLRKGDEVYVETRRATYVYQLDNGGTDLTIPFTQTWVTDRVPVNPDKGGVQPTASSKRIITLVTCSEIFHTDNRSVVFGHLVDVEKTKGAGHVKVPAATAAPSDSGVSVWWWLLGGAVVVGVVVWVVRRRRG